MNEVWLISQLSELRGPTIERIPLGVFERREDAIQEAHRCAAASGIVTWPSDDPGDLRAHGGSACYFTGFVRGIAYEVDALRFTGAQR